MQDILKGYDSHKLNATLYRSFRASLAKLSVDLNIDVPVSRKLSRKGTEVKELEKYRYQVEEKDVMNANKGCSQTGQSRETKG